MTGPVEPVEEWERSAHLVSPAYPPQLEAVRQARGFVRTQLEAIGLDECADDAGLMVSELAANAVLHARSDFTIHLRPTLEGGVRVEVHDGSPWPPVLTAHSESAMSGRGLDLVATMATRWGSHPLLAPPATPDPPGADPGPDAGEQAGKMVWFEVEPSGLLPVVDANTEELLALWSDVEEDGRVVARVPDGVGAGAAAASSGPGTRSSARTAGIITSSMTALEPTREVVVPDLPVPELLAAKEAMDDVLRELQLLLLATPAHGTHLVPADGPAGRDAQLEEERATAARLDAAARGFEQGRRQVREQVTLAAERGQQVIAIRLRLPTSARLAAERYRDAVEAAGDLSRTGHLHTLSDGLERHTQVRRHYLDEVIRQLPADGS